LPSGPLGFSCKLPIYQLDSNNPAQSLVGFLSLPDGRVTLQPAPTLPAGSVVTVDQTGPKPLYPSAFYYDRAVSTWVPVSRGAVSPDGSHYAYMSFPALDGGVMNVVDVATGAVRTYPATYAAFTGARYLVMDYAQEGIYLGLAYEGLGGVSLMNPDTGAIRDAGPYYFYPVMVVAGSAVWFGTTNPADPNPAPGPAGVPDSVDSFNFISGSQTPWLYLPGTFLQVVAVDAAGHPIVLVGHGSGGNAELLLVARPGAAQQIFHGTQAELVSITASIATGRGGSVADSHGIWFGSPAGIYLYSPGVGTRKVSDQAGYPGNGCV